MNIKKYWMLLTIALVALCTFSCSKNDDDTEPEKKIENQDDTTETKDFTATTAIKTAKIIRSEKYRDFEKAITIYEDFYRKYCIGLCSGKIQLIPCVRMDGDWRVNCDYNYDLSYYRATYSYYVDCGKCNSISEVTSKIQVESRSNTPYLTAEPNHGYAAAFLTGENEAKYLRMYISGYTLDDSGSLSSITVQYQLY